MSVYYGSVVQLRKMIANLDAWLAKAEAHAAAKSFDPDVLVSCRLAPDQYPLARQVQAACDGAKMTAARLADKEAPKHEDNETTLAALRARTAVVIAYLDTFSEADFAEADGRLITLPFLPGMVIGAEDYLIEMALPNTLFHVSMAYAILRHNGVELGKRDYIGSLNMRPA